MFFAHLGGRGGLHKNVSQISGTINFSSGDIAGKTLSVRTSLYKSNTNSSQTNHLNLDKFGMGNDIPDHQSALFALTTGLLTRPRPDFKAIVNLCNTFKLLIDFRLELFGGGGGGLGSQTNAQNNVSCSKIDLFSSFGFFNVLVSRMASAGKFLFSISRPGKFYLDQQTLLPEWFCLTCTFSS